MKKWRLIDTGKRTAAENMCLDEAMLKARGEGIVPNTLRFLQFEPHCALVGFHQCVDQEIRTDYCRLAGIDINDYRYKDKSAREFKDNLKTIQEKLSEFSSPEDAMAYLLESIDIFSGFKDILRMITMTDEIKNLIIQNIESPDVIIESIAVIKKELPAQLKNGVLVPIIYQ